MKNKETYLGFGLVLLCCGLFLWKGLLLAFLGLLLGYSIYQKCVEMVARYNKTTVQLNSTSNLVLGGLFLVSTSVISGVIIYFLFKSMVKDFNLVSFEAHIVQLLRDIHKHVPAWLYIAELDTLKLKLIEHLQKHIQDYSLVGYHFLKNLVLFVICLFLGILTRLTCSQCTSHKLIINIGKQGFGLFLLKLEQVFYAQIKISAINTVFTAIYILIILPLLGIHLPYGYILILFTFIFGLIPVLGNLISNTLIILVSLGLGFTIAIYSLIFLVVIHKLEYFLNAKIIGLQIKSTLVELLLCYIVFETFFGIQGIILAPIIYAYIKAELSSLDLI